MVSPLERAIRAQLHRYLAGQQTLPEFNRRFVQATSDVDRAGSQGDIDRTHEIFLRLAEYDRGDWTPDESKRMFRSRTDVGLQTPVSI